MRAMRASERHGEQRAATRLAGTNPTKQATNLKVKLFGETFQLTATTQDSKDRKHLN
jgi:hypothetical protein